MIKCLLFECIRRTTYDSRPCLYRFNYYIFIFLGFLIIHNKRKKIKLFYFRLAFILTILSISFLGDKFLVVNLFFDYFPLYSKFRSITMILVIVEIAIPILAIIGLSKLLENDTSLINIRKKNILFSSFFILVLSVCYFILLFIKKF